MSLLQEATLERLWSKYESRFGAPPPIRNAGLDEAISLLREKLAETPAGGSGTASSDFAVPNFMHGSAQVPHFRERPHV